MRHAAYVGKDLTKVVCHECGHQGFSLKNLKGTEWFGFEGKPLTLTVNFELITCDRCGDSIMGSDDIEASDEAVRRTLMGERDE